MFFNVCLGVLVLCNARGLEYDDVARAASRSSGTGTSGATPVRGTAASVQSATKSCTQGAISTRSGTTNSRERATTVTPAPSSETRSSTKNVATRSAQTTPTRTTGTAIVTPTRSTATSVASRSAVPSGATRGTTTAARTATARTARRTSSRTNTSSSRSALRGISRAATTTGESVGLVTNYTRCRDIYYECMDEFCANKDANLRRCACSARANEFDSVKKQMNTFEDKMLDFNQRLLLVNLDAEDVNAINTATAGEEAFYATKDTTASKRALDDIAKKLNTTFGDDASGTSLAPISLTLNLDSAFDTVDSFMGSDTTTRSGTALYNAAIPICRETALEVCTEDELSLAIGGYQMLMEQDCNTVQKSYQAQVDAARTKVFESSALLDMSRLDAYQTRNSDDILTCKRKMLEMLTDGTVCGANMEKCLDMTGKYIDPTTGAAFLTSDLANLDNLISRPSANQTWLSANSSGKFVSYLRGKQQYILSATTNCQDIADTVWDSFLEDALAQIKLAQTNKLQEIRVACTTLTSECLTSASESIAEFDARALSTFGVLADRTANAMCADVRNACTALMGDGGDTAWETGISSIAISKTFDTLIASCTQVGRNCIIQSCRSINGNFALCDDINYSANRHAILERTSCWPDVLNCVGSAGDAAIGEIMASLGKSMTDDFHSDLGYGTTDPGDNICDCESVYVSDIECAKCHIAERIWGNCEADPNTTIEDENENSPAHNRILMPAVTNDTLLSWFALNTGTASDNRSCVNTRCTTNDFHPGYMGPTTPICVPAGDNNNITDDGLYCPDPHHRMDVAPDTTNCCFNSENLWNHTFIPGISGALDACCEGTLRDDICLPNGVSAKKILATNGSKQIICIGSNDFSGGGDTNGDFPSGDQLQCAGTFIMVDGTNYTEPDNKDNNGTGGTYYRPRMGYYTAPGTGQTVHQVPDTWRDSTNNNNARYIRYGND